MTTDEIFDTFYTDMRAKEAAEKERRSHDPKWSGKEKHEYCVTFKDEDEVDGIAIGPVHVTDITELLKAGGTMTPIGPTFTKEFGAPLPEFIRNLGWLTKPEAIRIAKVWGTELIDS